MTADDETIRDVRAWLDGGVTMLPKRVLDAVLLEIPRTRQRSATRLWWRLRPVPSAFRGAAALAASIALIVGLVGVMSVRGLPDVFGPGVSASPRVSPVPSESPPLMGLPPAGARITPGSGAPLVLRYEGNLAGDTMLWLYADGLLVEGSIRQAPTAANPVGLTVRRLTPVGVELVRQRALNSGVFSVNASYAASVLGFASFRVKAADKYLEVQVHGGLPSAAPGASDQAPSQAQLAAIRDLSRYLSDRSSWPETSWADRVAQPYVPGGYAICMRRVPTPDTVEAIRARLPLAAQQFLNTNQEAQFGSCIRLATPETLAFARLLVELRVGRDNSENDAWLRFRIVEPGSGEANWYSFEPVLPDGEQTWLGPG